MFLKVLGPGKRCEQRITESLTELFWEFYSVVWVEEFGGITEAKLFLNQFSNLFVCNGAQGQP